MTDPQTTGGPQTLRDAKTLSPEERARIRRNVEKMQAAKAPPEHIQAYLRDVEKLAPTVKPPQAGEPRMAPVVASIPETTPGRQFLTEVGQGASLGFMDEALGGMNALPGGAGGKTAGERYRYARDLVRAADADAKKAHPVGSAATQAASGVLTSLPAMLPRAAKLVTTPLTLGQQVATGAKAGAATGAAYGAASGVGNAEGGLEDRARAGAAGAVYGAAGGAALGAVSPLVAKTVTQLRDLVGRQQLAAGTKAAADAKAAILSGITDPVERQQIEALIAHDPVLGPAFNGTRPLQLTVAPEQGGLQPRTGAIGNIGGMGSGSPLRSNVPRAAPADASRVVATAEDRANEELLKVLGRDKQTPASIRDAYRTAQAQGETPLNLMDLSGENAQGLGRAARATPSTAKNIIPKVLEARGKEAEARVIGKLVESSGQGRRINLTQTIDQMAEERSKDADKLYAPIRDQIVDAPEVADALKMEPLRKAYERARQITTSKAGAAKLRGAGDGAPALPAYADLFAKDGTLKKPLTLGQLDQIKRGLDDMLETAPRSPADAGGLGNEGMGALRDLKNAYVGVLDAAVPEYAQARQTFAGHSEMIRAFELGQKLYSTSPDKSSALLAEMSRDAQDAFRKGAVEATAQRVENITPGNSVSLRIGDRTLDRQRLRLLFPDDDSYNAFRSSLAQEALAHATKRNVLGNSATVDKLAEYADLAGVDLGSVLQHAEAGPKGMVGRLLTSGAAKLKSRSMASKADALAPKLLASGKSLEDVIAGLEAAQQRLAASQGRRVARTAATSAGIATATPKPRSQ
jgi:hypothetical protein